MKVLSLITFSALIIVSNAGDGANGDGNWGKGVAKKTEVEKKCYAWDSDNVEKKEITCSHSTDNCAIMKAARNGETKEGGVCIPKDAKNCEDYEKIKKEKAAAAGLTGIKCISVNVCEGNLCNNNPSLIVPSLVLLFATLLLSLTN